MCRAQEVDADVGPVLAHVARRRALRVEHAVAVRHEQRRLLRGDHAVAHVQAAAVEAAKGVLAGAAAFELEVEQLAVKGVSPAEIGQLAARDHALELLAERGALAVCLETLDKCTRWLQCRGKRPQAADVALSVAVHERAKIEPVRLGERVVEEERSRAGGVRRGSDKDGRHCTSPTPNAALFTAPVQLGTSLAATGSSSSPVQTSSLDTQGWF